MKYIIITFDITNIGGEQQYCRNKVVALKKMGYDVYLFSAHKGPIYIQDLKEYQNNIMVELKYPVYCFSKQNVNNTIDSIVKVIGEDDGSAIIETVNGATAQWGELLARRYNCKHVCFALDEAYTVSKSESKFLKFKHDRKELAGIAVQTLPKIFEGYYNISESEAYYIDAACSNVVQDCKNEIIDSIPESDYNIGSIGRLEKGFVYPTLNKIKQFALEHSNMTFNVILIGGTTEKSVIRKLKKIVEKIDNLRLIITGFIYPIPRQLVQQVDVFISTAGSALVSVDEKVPTISVDTYTGAPIGILNYTTKENMYATDNSIYLSDLLKEVLFNDYCNTHDDLGMSFANDDNVFADEVIKQLNFAKQCSDKEYYDVFSLQPTSLKYKVYMYVGRVCGVRNLELIKRNILHNLKMAYAYIKK